MRDKIVPTTTTVAPLKAYNGNLMREMIL
jgi:hypothetical protein